MRLVQWDKRTTHAVGNYAQAVDDDFGIDTVEADAAGVTESLLFEAELLCLVTVGAPPSFVFVHSAGT